MFRKLKSKSEFSRNVLTLMTGTTIAQAIPIAISPILTRIYTPEDFGVFALYMAIVSIIAIFITGRYELAIMLPKNDKYAINIFFLSLIITTIISIILFVIVLLFHDSLISILGSEDISTWLYFIPLSVFLLGLYQSLNYWFNRKKEYRNISINKITRSGTVATSNIITGLIGLGAKGLILSSIISQLVINILFIKIFIKRYQNLFVKIKLYRMQILAKKYIKFPTWNLGASFLHTSKENVLQIFMYKFFSTSFLGFYFFANKIIKTPSSILITSFSDVYYQRISKISSKEDIFLLSISYTKKIFFVLIIPYIVFIYILEDFIPFIFGDKWSILYMYIYIISLPIFLNLIVSHFSKILIVVNKQEISFYFHLFKFIGFILMLVFLYIFNMFSFEALILLSMFEIFWSIIGVVLIREVLEVKYNLGYIYSLGILLVIFELIILMEV